MQNPEVTREVFVPREGPVQVSSEAASPGTLGSEWNLTIWPWSLVRTDRGSFGPAETGSLRGVRWLSYFAARCEFAEPVDVWYFPLQTVSKSEKGFDWSVQATTLLFTGRGARLLYRFECPS